MGILTPAQQIQETLLRKNSLKLIEVGDENQDLKVEIKKLGSILPGMMLLVLSREEPKFPLIPIAEAEVTRVTAQFTEKGKRIPIADLKIREGTASSLVKIEDFVVTPATYQAAILQN